MKSLMIVLLLASGASAELIVDHPAGVTWTGFTSAIWQAQRFSVNATTEISEIEAYVQRQGGLDEPNVAIYTDNGGEPGDLPAGTSIPKDEIFSTPLPVPVVSDFFWRSTGELNEGPILEPGTYWLAVRLDSPTTSMLISIADEPNMEERSRAARFEEPIFDENGGEIGSEFRWSTIGSPTLFSIRIHGEAVPEPATTSLLFCGVLISVMSSRRSTKNHRAATGEMM